MSKSNNKTTQTRADKKKLLVRILAGAMAFIMVASTAYILISSISAEEPETATIETIGTSSLKNGVDVLVSVGLMYGTNLTTGFQTTTTDGYTLGIQQLDGDKEFEEIWDIDDTVVSCTSDANLSKTGMTYLIAENRRETAIGGYHIQVDCDYLDRDEVERLIGDTERDVEDLSLYIIPSYIYSGYALRIGTFSSWDEADEYLDEVEDIFRGEKVSIVEPTDTAVSLLNPYSDEILFEFDCGGESELGLMAHEDENGNTYIQTPATNVYDGVFCFKRYDNGETDGVSLINVIPLEAYLAGVLPYETSNTWPLETLKAFAITVRSYTLTHINKHKSYNFDLCNTTDCQVYKGAGRINERVMDAVLDTAGQVLTYNNEIVNAYYSSSMGGVTVSAQDAWGGKDDVPYLQAVETPWENYMVHNNAFWIVEISPEALLERLHTAGYEELEDAVEDVDIIELAKNSTYVKKLRVTDIHGNSIDIEYTDNVRTSLTPYVKSANFVVGRGEVEYTENVIVDYVEDEESEDIAGVDTLYDRDYGYINLDDFYVMTSNSLDKASIDSSVSIMTGNGDIPHERRDIFVMTRQNAAAFLGDDYLKYIDQKEEVEEKHNTSIIEEKSTSELIYKIAYAEDDDNFIFVGKGWGHGVGMSQYGARDLANQGYKARDILEAYFTDTAIIHYEDSDNFR